MEGLSFNNIGLLSGVSKVNEKKIQPSFRGISCDNVNFSETAEQLKNAQLRLKQAEAKNAELDAKTQEAEDLFCEKLQEYKEIRDQGYDIKDNEYFIALRNMNKARRNENSAIRAFNKNVEYIRKLELLIEKIKTSPASAFLYDPDIPPREVNQKLQQTDCIKTPCDIARELNVPEIAVNTWCREGRFEVFERQAAGYKEKLIDKESDKNSKFLEEITPQLKNYISGERLIIDYGIYAGDLKNMINEGELSTVGLDFLGHDIGALNAIINLDDPKNAEVINRLLKSKTYSSKEFYSKVGKSGTYISAAYFQRIGYAKTSDIRRLVEEGAISGKVTKRQTEEGVKTRTLVDMSSFAKAVDALNLIRETNPNLYEKKQLSKEFGIKDSVIREAIKNLEVDIVNEYLIREDVRNVYIDISTPKNKEFIEKCIFENEVLKEIKEAQQAEKQEASAQKRAKNASLMSLKMRITWHMCDNTRQIAKNLAKSDAAYLSTIFEKEENEEELDFQEEITLNSYRKEFWQEAGTEEFTAARNRAEDIVREYLAGGLDAVEEDWAKEMIEESGLTPNGDFI